jgi:hypothetical protein
MQQGVRFGDHRLSRVNGSQEDKVVRIGRIWLVFGGLMFVPLCAGAASHAPTPSATTTTAMPGAEEHWFKLDWSVAPHGAGARRIDGYVYNSYGRPADNMRILSQAYDQSGALIAQKLTWVMQLVPPSSRAYFIVDDLPPADRYRVSVWSFDFMNGHH